MTLNEWRRGVAGIALLGVAAVAGAQEPGPPPLFTALLDAPLTPAGHVRDARLALDRFAFTLDEGDLYVLSTEDGAPAAAVYLGRGTLRFLPPDGVEHQQLERAIDEDLFEDAFDRFVIWFTGDAGARLTALAGGAPGRDARRAKGLLDDRRDALREDQLANPDGRVVAGLWRREDLPSAPPFVHVEVDTDDHGWVSLEIEPFRREPVSVWRYDTGRRGIDIWQSFAALPDGDAPPAAFPRDPGADGGGNGDRDARDLGLPPRPAAPAPWAPRVAVPRTDADLALEGDGTMAAVAALVVEPRVPLAALRLQVSPLVQVTGVHWRTAPAGADDLARPLLPPGGEPDTPAPPGGEPVPFIQLERPRRLADNLYEPTVTVLFPRVLRPGERVVVEVAYDSKVVEQVQATRDFYLQDTLGWLPRHPDAELTRFDLTFRVPETYRVASGGRLADERVEDGTRVMRWVTARPARAMMAFHYGRFDVSEVAEAGLPPISIFGNRNRLGFAPGNRQATIDTLVAAVRTFTGFFGPFPFDTLAISETPAFSAQAFPGLVLLSFQAFGEMNASEAAFLRAHEVAHQWWGASVGWEDYRDQWIAEGFAHYAAALFALHGRDAPGEFAEMIDTWRRDLTGEVTIGIGRGRAYYGVGPAVVRDSDGTDAGPLVAGLRLSTPEKPSEYQLIAYEKGALVLHMLRAMLADADGGDGRFLALLRDFARAHADGEASTAAFETAVTAAFGAPMDWFFDQWVYGTDVPTYQPNLDVVATGEAAAPFALRGTVRQDDVFDGFRMPVPIAVEFDDGRREVHVVDVNAAEVAVDIPLPARPARVVFNDGNAVLARVR